MTKVVVNKRYGGFGLSDAGIRAYAEAKGITLYPENGQFGMVTYFTVPTNERVGEIDFYNASMSERTAYNQRHHTERLYDGDLERDDPILVDVVERLGNAANGKYARLEVTEVPDDVDWEIGEYDGQEWVQEKHRTW